MKMIHAGNIDAAHMVIEQLMERRLV